MNKQFIEAIKKEDWFVRFFNIDLVCNEMEKDKTFIEHESIMSRYEKKLTSWDFAKEQINNNFWGNAIIQRRLHDLILLIVNNNENILYQASNFVCYSKDYKGYGNKTLLKDEYNITMENVGGSAGDHIRAHQKYIKDIITKDNGIWV